MSCYVKMIYVNNDVDDRMDEMDAMSPEYGPGAKAGNPFIDIITRQFRKNYYEPKETLKKILIFELINTLELIINDKENK